MYKKIFFTLAIVILISMPCFARLDVVYPSSKVVTVNSDSAFFLGNTDVGSILTINSVGVKLWEDNFFVHSVPLNMGRNEINITSLHNGETESVTYIVNRNKSASSGGVSSSYTHTGLLSTKTKGRYATLRAKPSSYATRLIDLPKGVTIYLSGKQGNYYRVDSNEEIWINKSDIETPVAISEKIEPQLLNKEFTSDEHYNYIKFTLSYPAMYTFKHNGKDLSLTIYGIRNSDGNNYTYTYSTNSEIIGYDGYYEGNTLVFRIAKTLENSEGLSSLAGVRIFVDPGHGGSEKGSVGPTRVPEKDINLYISTYLIKYLKDAGAVVTTSRTYDTTVPLYDRVQKAKDDKALISVSIHANALPNGKDPYKTHGTEVHYYNENAKQLAEIIKNNLVYDVHLKDNGIHKSSFALDRATNPVSVLVEVAYMIYPEEYIKLKNPEFQEKVAQSIKKSLEQYIYMLKK